MRPTSVRRVQVVIASSAVVLASFLAGCTTSVADSGPGSAGSELYATRAGVVWSFTPDPHHGQVARSTDGGRTWHVVLPGPGPHQGLGLSGSFFLGSDLGWVVYQHILGKGSPEGQREATSVMGTSDGGQHWWRSPTLPGAGVGCCGSALGYTPYFTDSRHGWLYGMGWTVQGDMVWEADEELWRTSDAGHTWTLVRGHLPLQGTTDQDDEICPDEGPFQVAFANQQDGWLTASSCGTIGSAPRVWRTTDGGLTWTAVALPAPPQGWPSADDTYDGVLVGKPWIVGSQLLVAIEDRSEQATLDIEASSDSGRSWHLASRVSLAGQSYALPNWFEPVSSSHWAVSAPGELTRTSDGGRTWHVAGQEPKLTGGPFWFTSPGQGYERGPGHVVLMTRDGGRTWDVGAAPPVKRPALGPAIGAVQELSPTFAVASGLSGLRVSRDGGHTWTSLSLGPGPHPLRSAQFLTPGTGFAVDHTGRRLWSTANGGRTWTALARPPRQVVDQQVDHVQFWSPAAGVAITRQHSLYQTATGGRTWLLVTPPSGYYPDVFNRPRDAYACFGGASAGWLVADSMHSPGAESVFATADEGTSWHQVLPAFMLRSGRVNAQRYDWLSGCIGTAAWVQVSQSAYQSGGATAYDLLHTTDFGRNWQDVLRVQNGSTFPPLAAPRSPGASPALPSGVALTPEPLALTSSSAAWQTLLAPDGGVELEVTADGGQHWLGHWFPAPARHPRTAPASPSGLPSGLPWLATTATDAIHAWVLFGSTDGSGDSYLYATADGGATWQRLITFR